MTEQPNTDGLLFTPEERAYLEALAIQLAIAQKGLHSAAGALAAARGLGTKWELKQDRSGFTITDK